MATVTAIEYSGLIWCPTVSTGAFVARRNGKVFITGNSGFPKSMDVSKAIDKAGGSSPREQADMLRLRREAAGLTREQVAEHCGCTPSSVRDWEEGRARASGAPIEFIVPSAEYRAKLANLLGYSADERRLIGKTSDRRGDETVYGVGHSGELREGGITEAARQWSGWGTALKPALEPITLARKPLVGTVAANVLAHGTGALNIDGCRIAGSDKPVPFGNPTQSEGWGLNKRKTDWRPSEIGRFPANLIHDGSDDVLAGFPQSSAKNGVTQGEGKGGIWSESTGKRAGPTHGDAGSAARFFYCAKASKKDRGEGNAHPTVKPTELMRYLCRLVTPPGGTVLDPFMGSGSTGKAALLEGFSFVGVESEQESFDTAVARIGFAGSARAVAAAEAAQMELL